MALNFTSYIFRFPVGSTSAQGWQNRLNASLRFLLPTARNVNIKKIGVFPSYQYETTTATANEAIVTPWYRADMFLMSNDQFLQGQRGRTPDPVLVKGLASPVFIAPVPDAIVQVTHHQPLIDVDVIANGLTLYKFGYYNPSGAPATIDQIEVVITIGWEEIC